MYRNVLECIGMYWNVQECIGMVYIYYHAKFRTPSLKKGYWNVQECIGMYWNVQESIGMYSNVQEWSRSTTMQNFELLA